MHVYGRSYNQHAEEVHVALIMQSWKNVMKKQGTECGKINNNGQRLDLHIELPYEVIFSHLKIAMILY